MSLFLALLLITARPEQAVSAPVTEAAAFNQEHGRIASDGDGFLVVWQNEGHVSGVRLSRDGQRTGGILTISGADYAVDPEVAAGREGWLVVWHQDGGVVGRMIAADGSMDEPVAIAAEPYVWEPRVAFNGEVFLVLWRSVTSGLVRGAIVDPAGRVRSRLEIGKTTTEVVAARSAFWILGGSNEVTLTRVDADGTVGEPRVMAQPGTWIANAQLASRGDDVVIAWNDELSATAAIRGVTVPPAGDPQPFESGQGWLRRLVPDGDDVMVLFAADNEYARRLGSSETHLLTKLPGPGLVSDGASNGSAVVFVRLLDRGDSDLYLERLGTGGVELLSVAPRHQFSPEIASIGDTSLVVWSELPLPDREGAVRAAIVTPDGARPAIDITSGRAQYAVATNGSEFFVAWTDGSGLHGARIALSGDVLGRFDIAGDVFPPLDVAWDGEAWIVVFVRGSITRDGRIFTRLFATRVAPDGTAGPEIDIAGEEGYPSPSIAAGRETVAIVWDQSGALLSRGGTVMPLSLPMDSPHGPPAVAFNGKTFLIAAARRETVEWFLVSESGVVTQQQPLALMAPSIDVSAVGDRFLLAGGDRLTLLDPRGWAGDSVSVGATAHLSGSTMVYARTVDPAWPNITRVFVRSLVFEPNPPKRRSAR